MATETAGGVPDSMLARVRTLLAQAERASRQKGADRDDFANEAAALSAKAAGLMLKYSISDAMIGAIHVDTTELVARKIPVLAPYTKEKATLLAVVARAFNVATMSYIDARGWRFDAEVELMGYPNDIDKVEFLFTSLLLQGAEGLQTLTPSNKREHTASFRSFWFVAFTDVVNARLHEARVAATDEHDDANPDGPGSAMVLADRMSVVQRWADQRYADKSVRESPPVYTRGEGQELGRQAGQTADIDQDRLAGVR